MPSFEPIKALTNAIPEFYYDLIARVVPGVVILVAGTLMYVNLFASQYDKSAWGTGAGDESFLLMLVLAYFIGILLGPFGAFVRHPFWWWAKYRTNEQSKKLVRCFVSYDGNNNDPFDQLDDFKSFEKMVEKELLDHSPHDKMVLVKMWAESDMCMNVLAGIILVNITFFLVSFSNGAVEPWYKLQLFVLPAIIVTIIGANHRHRGVIRRDFAYVNRLNLIRKDIGENGKSEESSIS